MLNYLEIAPGSEDWDCPYKEWVPYADPKWVVKSYSRPAAGQEMADASELRPPDVLKETIYHLLHNIVPRNDGSWASVYDFVFNRLRAVRQDMVIQDLSIRDCIAILEPIARFHVYAGYRLCEEPISKYDAKINQTHVSECLKRLLMLYDDWEREGEEGPDLEHRVEMEVLYQLSYLGEPEALKRAFLIGKQWRTPLMLTAIEMSLQLHMGNYVRVCRLMSSLPPLFACAAILHLPAVRRHALCVMSTAFSSRTLRYPTSHLHELLLYGNQEELRKDCLHYKLDVQEEGILFLKGTFDKQAPLSPPRHIPFIDEALSECSISLLLRGESEVKSEVREP